MQTKPINVLNQDTGEFIDSEALMCDCGGHEFLVYKVGCDNNHVHLQCTRCDKPHCSLQHAEAAGVNVQIKTKEDSSEGFCE